MRERVTIGWHGFEASRDGAGASMIEEAGGVGTKGDAVEESGANLEIEEGSGEDIPELEGAAEVNVGNASAGRRTIIRVVCARGVGMAS